ncbi:hypothetical protein [Rhodopila sp.]|uniref:hypothetical protein n=1 Tax=Rhodopila sp. TaxID=2480087 RepID=UPI003D143566
MFIADACALLAYFGGGGRTMGRAGMDAMRADEWELSLNVAGGKLPPLPTERGSFAKHLAELGLREVTLLCGDAEAANALPPHRRDPMDRMSIAHRVAHRTDRHHQRCRVSGLWGDDGVVKCRGYCFYWARSTA